MASDAPAAALPPDGYVRLVSSGGQEYLISRRHACVSKVLAAMLDGSFLEAHTRTVHLQNMRSAVLEKLCQYLYFAVRRRGAAGAADEGAGVEGFDVPNEMYQELLSAALYLDL
jgi:elongin-C